MKNELYNVLSGKSQVRYGTIIQTIANHLKESSFTSSGTENEQYSKKEETKELSRYITLNHLWIQDINFSQYISEGAEQKVYLKDEQHVIKLNDTIYYSFWVDYLNNLLLHNFFFPDTAYELLGFTKENDVMYAVVRQSFVKITQTTKEDLHDENVLTQNDMLYFIDTVFYLTDSFWNKEKMNY